MKSDSPVEERLLMMVNRKSIRLYALLLLLNLGCSRAVYETIKSDPSQADIYWGQTSSNLEKSEYKTPFIRTIPESKIEPWCFRLKKDGYHNSNTYCREKELSWLINVKLAPLKTTITSEPPGAMIYWGPSEDKIYKTEHVTPHTESQVNLGANWKDWYFQVKKDEYNASPIAMKAREESDRHVHFDLVPAKQDVRESKSKQWVSTKNQVTLSWEYQYPSTVLGFEIERRSESDTQFKKIADVGPNETSYTDTGTIPGATYYYRMRAYEASLKSEYTDEIKVMIMDNSTAIKK